jgi:uncharacterized membrane protein (UPF0127 family)
VSQQFPAHRTPGPAGLVTRSACLLALVLGGCTSGAGNTPTDRNNLDTMKTATIRINQQPFEVWLALTPDEQEHGLMQVTAEQLAPIPATQPGGAAAMRGMLFVFGYEMPLSFWMYNTITPLDIAYIDAEGTIVKTYTMAPLETRIYPSVEPAQFALEVRAGLFGELGIAAGQHVEIPESVLKR